MSGRRPCVQRDEALNLVLLDPRSGTEPDKDFPDHDQDAGDDEACVSANTDRCAVVSAKEILNENFEDDAARAVFYLGIIQLQLRFIFKNNMYGPRKPSRRQVKDNVA